MAHVFLSYSRIDADYVANLARSLKERGIDVWMDDEIEPGSRYDRVIQQHIEGCGAVVLIMSEHSRNSDWVANELEYAKEHNKVVLPLLLGGGKWLRFAATQHVDVIGGSLPPDDFYDRLLRVLSSKRERTEPEPADPA